MSLKKKIDDKKTLCAWNYDDEECGEKYIGQGIGTYDYDNHKAVPFMYVEKYIDETGKSVYRVMIQKEELENQGFILVDGRGVKIL